MHKTIITKNSLLPMNKKKLTLLLACAAVQLGANAEVANHPDSVYLITYNTSNPKDGIHAAYSVDKERWIEIGQNRSFVKSDFGAWGSQKNMYSPSVLLDSDGTWYAVWALNDKVGQIATTSTKDLWLWKPQDYPYLYGKGNTAESTNVIEPILTKEGNEFKVTYKTSSGDYYYVTSGTFKTWSKPQKTSADSVKPRQVKAVVSGTEVKGDVNRVAWSLVENLIAQSQAATYRDEKNAETMSQDATRFNGLKDVKATLNVNLSSSKDISKELIGIFFEDINYAADGGIYAELIQNRDFEYSNRDRGDWNARTAWSVTGVDMNWDIMTDNPIHANNSHYSVLDVAKVGASLVNEGFDGIALKAGEKYNLSLFTRSLDGDKKKLKISLVDGSNILASTTVDASKEWAQRKATLTVKTAANAAKLVIEPQNTGKVAIDFVSLFPNNTFKNRKNGMRADLAQTLADIHPKFVRFPGGCATHGNGIDNIYHWKNTIGPLHERKGDYNIWGYHQSVGLGFYEYFQFCEDIGASPLPVLAAGVPCQNSSRGGDGQQGGIPMEEMEQYLQEILDLIEWANGDPKTSELAKLRAEAGHPKPFGLKYLGIGNEDLISDTFVERYNYLCRAVAKQHPEITVVGTVGPFFEGSDYEYGWQIAKEEKLPIVDEHYYNPAGWFINNQDFYDKYERNSTKVYLGEYASKGNNLENALAEAVHLTNIERNADVVVMTSYAPLLAKEGHTQWNPDLIYFNNIEVKPTVNYQVQKLFGQNSGSKYISNILNVDNNRDDVRKRVSASVVKDETTGDIIIKLVNCLPTNVATAVDLGSISGYSTTADKTVLTGNFNERWQKPETSTLEVSDKFDYELPAYSFTVLRLKAQTTKKK